MGIDQEREGALQRVAKHQAVQHARLACIKTITQTLTDQIALSIDNSSAAGRYVVTLASTPEGVHSVKVIRKWDDQLLWSFSAKPCGPERIECGWASVFNFDLQTTGTNFIMPEEFETYSSSSLYLLHHVEAKIAGDMESPHPTRVQERSGCLGLLALVALLPLAYHFR